MNDGSMDDGSIKGKVKYNRQQATKKKHKKTRNEDDVSRCILCYLILNATQNQLSLGVYYQL